MNDFDHIAAGLRLYAGSKSLKALPAELERLGSRRPAVFCGKTVGSSPELLSGVKDVLGKSIAVVFDGVVAHSPIETVRAGAELLRESQADAVIAVGGGSAIVTARAASILTAEKGDLRELCSYRDSAGRLQSPKLMEPKLPQFLVPTTPTTAMVKAGSGVIDTCAGQRLTMFDPKTRAHAIFIDPRLAMSAPRQLVLTASLNAFAMAVEGLESTAGNPLSDGLLMHSLRLLSRNLSLLKSGGGCPGVRTDLMLASIVCGQGTDHASPGVVAALGHSLGICTHVDNGFSNAILLPHTMQFNAPVTGNRLQKVSEALGHLAGGRGAEAAISAVKDLFASLNLPQRLRDVGVRRESLRCVAKTSLDDWFLYCNPRPIRDEATVMSILEAAW